MHVKSCKENFTNQHRLFTSAYSSVSSVHFTYQPTRHWTNWKSLIYQTEDQTYSQVICNPYGWLLLIKWYEENELKTYCHLQCIVQANSNRILCFCVNFAVPFNGKWNIFQTKTTPRCSLFKMMLLMFPLFLGHAICPLVLKINSWQFSQPRKWQVLVSNFFLNTLGKFPISCSLIFSRYFFLCFLTFLPVSWW